MSRRYTLPSVEAAFSSSFDEIIDVRSPAEFAEDSLPGAINLPVLNDEERARVGTIYKQTSPFDARKIGAALVARNTGRHLEEALSDRDGSWRPLVYCWRGGQRSGAFATILSQIGWRVSVLEGGYQSFRRAVVKRLYHAPLESPVLLLDGDTGTAKTAILHRLAARGVQVLDLEGLAAHRGSLFGGLAGPQPDQKAFETALAGEIVRLSPDRPVVVEAESSRIGERNVPPSLWNAMKAAPRLQVTAPLAARAAYTARTYDELCRDPAALADVLDQLRPLHPRERIEHWHELAQGHAFEALAAELMERHYDPRYRRMRERGDAPAAILRLDDLSEESLSGAAEEIEERLPTLFS
ncbi:tRNA 2-selenouridine(34) synthase MnmH [Parvularcula oceani]|uniref:tRNA 2-selenouridine(34) synthase MnmH n=1 Tax=Parvularcula oceani TaxID=1247963 RepID=UPI0004E1D16D|nr:tRNA 2-selenouridine(34) synthase MnmH [Parvularcula oceani]